jgi:hypothetical protein
LGFIPADQRKFTYNFVFPLSLTISRIAEKHGGRPYATGLYYTKMAAKILGAGRTEALKALKPRVDPKGILNPGKVIGNGVISNALIAANAFEPLLRPFGNAVTAQIGEKHPQKPVRDIPGDVAWYASACSQCGYCVQECDQYYGRGWESQRPRGKWYWLRASTWRAASSGTRPWSIPSGLHHCELCNCAVRRCCPSSRRG